MEQQEESTYEILREGDETVLKVDYDRVPSIPSIEDNAACMSKTMEKLIAIIIRRSY
jgi:hypothetical protein